MLSSTSPGQGNDCEVSPTRIIDDNTVRTFPNLVVVNFGEHSHESPIEDVYDGTRNNLHYLNLGNQEIAAMKRAKKFTWLNINENEWMEICGGSHCHNESVNRNVHDYLELQKMLWKSSESRGRNKFKSNLTVNQRVQTSLRGNKKEKRDKCSMSTRGLRTEGELKLAWTHVKSLEKHKIWVKLAKTLRSIGSALLPVSSKQMSKAVALRLIQTTVLYIGMTLLSLIILIPMMLSQDEYKKMERVPEFLLTVMSWISSWAPFFPVSAILCPPSPSPSYPWYYIIFRNLGFK